MLPKSFPFFRQLDSMDCGAACLKMISSYYGADYSIQFIREKCGITRQGVSALGICDAAEEIGLKSFVIDVSFESLSEEVPLPCIVHWRQRHFVVISKVSPKYVWVYDPAFGKIKYTKEKFLEGWLYNKRFNKNTEAQGFVILLEPASEQVNPKDDHLKGAYNLNFLRPYLRIFKSQIFQIILGILLSSLLVICIPFFTQALVDKGIKNKSINFIYLILAGQLMFFLSQTLMEITRRWLILFITRRVNVAIISDYLFKLMRLPIGFFDSKSQADLTMRIDDQKQISDFLSNTSLSVLFSLVNVVLFGGILLYYNYILFITFAIGAGIYFVWVLLFVKERVILTYRRRDEQVENRSSIIQLINGIHEIKLNNSEKKRRWEWESVQSRIYNTSRNELRIEQFQVVGGNFIMQITYLLITGVAAFSVVKGSLTLGMMLSTQYIIGQLTVPINSFVTFIQGAKEAKISIERLGEVFTLSEENNVNSAEIEMYGDQNNIVLEDLSFRYGSVNSALTLKHLDLVIPHGKITAVVGTSGSGKTTLVKLLLKFYKASAGRILVDEADLNEFSDNYWRSKCGVVMQDGFIFADTILRNITESNESYEIDKVKLQQAVKIANLEEMIEALPLGYQTNISTGGINLSGGENQRILIARAVYKNPEFLFFDEATSALDAHNEKIIMENLDSFFKGRTVVIIAHRLSTVKNADNIIVLEKGNIIEQGTHENLVQIKGNYFKLVKNQLELGV
jgi:ATP-binding cassette subfamily B protein